MRESSPRPPSQASTSSAPGTLGIAERRRPPSRAREAANRPPRRRESPSPSLVVLVATDPGRTDPRRDAFVSRRGAPRGETRARATSRATREDVPRLARDASSAATPEPPSRARISISASSLGFHPEHLSETPPGFFHAPILLGVAGAVPFVALAAPLAPILDPYLPEALFPVARRGEMQAAYGVTILSFLGGVHWGFATSGFGGAGAVALPAATRAARERVFLAGPVRFAWSVVPSLVAWPALTLSLPYQLVTVATSLGGALAVDAAYASAGLTPRWLMPLRFGLTATAVVSLLSSVPRAVETSAAAEAAEAETRRLRRDAPATREALEARERSLAKAKAAAARAREEANAFSARLSAAESSAATREAEWKMVEGRAVGGGGERSGRGATRRRRTRTPPRRSWPRRSHDCSRSRRTSPRPRRPRRRARASGGTRGGREEGDGREDRRPREREGRGGDDGEGGGEGARGMTRRRSTRNDTTTR